MHHPLLYEINTRCWLRELSERCRRPILLDSVPESEFQAWQRLGFTHIWLMGVYPTGPLARAQALVQRQQVVYSQALPDWKPEDVVGSPYAVAEYRPADSLGGETGLQRFRQTLHKHGLKLLLDFVPNHLGVDHPWVHERPELFVQSATPIPETFPVETAAGTRWLAHGKDPYFPAWTDTVQLDYRLSTTRQAMTELLLEIARGCDGVRCDMSMLLLNQVFSRTWARFPVTSPLPENEFWDSAIFKIKQAYPGFAFLAEAYWGLEPQLQALGFDYTYDKELYDKLMAGDAQAVSRHLLGLSPENLARGAHFLENHDEPRVAVRLSLAQHRAAALLILALPGMRFLHEGQLSGARLRTPVQLGRRSAEPEQTAIRQMYERFLTALKATSVGRGRARLLTAEPAVGGCVFIQWQTHPSEFNVAAVNLTNQRQRCRVLPVLQEAPVGEWEVSDLAATDARPPHSPLLAQGTLMFDLPEQGAQLLHVQRQGTAIPPFS